MKRPTSDYPNRRDVSARHPSASRETKSTRHSPRPGRARERKVTPMPRRHRPPTTEPARLVLRGEADRVLMRQIVNLFEGWRGCYRACRRHKACASPDVKCFDHNIEIAQE